MVNKEINIKEWDKEKSYIKNEIIIKNRTLYKANTNIDTNMDWDDSKFDVLSFSKDKYFKVDFINLVDASHGGDSCLVKEGDIFNYYTFSVDSGDEYCLENISIKNAVFYTTKNIKNSDDIISLNNIYMVFLDQDQKLNNIIDFDDFNYLNNIDLGNEYEFIHRHNFYMDFVDGDNNINGVLSYKSDNVSFHEGVPLITSERDANEHYDYIVKSITESPIIEEEGMTLFDLTTKKTYTSHYVEDHQVSYNELWVHFNTDYHLKDIGNRYLKKIKINDSIPVPMPKSNITITEEDGILPGIYLSIGKVDDCDCDKLVCWEETFWFMKQWFTKHEFDENYPRYIGALGDRSDVKDWMGSYDLEGNLTWKNTEITFNVGKWMPCFLGIPEGYFSDEELKFEWNNYIQNAFSFEITGTYFFEDELQKSTKCNILLFGDKNSVLATYDSNNRFHIVKNAVDTDNPIFIENTFSFKGHIPLDTGDVAEYDVEGPAFDFSNDIDYVIKGTITRDDGQQVFINERSPSIWVNEFLLNIYLFDIDNVPKISLNHFAPDFQELKERGMGILFAVLADVDLTVPVIMAGYHDSQFVDPPITYYGLEENVGHCNIQVWNSYYLLPQIYDLNVPVVSVETDENYNDTTVNYSNANSVDASHYVKQELITNETEKVQIKWAHNSYLKDYKSKMANVRGLWNKHGIIQLKYDDIYADAHYIISIEVEHSYRKKKETFYESISYLASTDDSLPTVNENVLLPNSTNEYKTRINVQRMETLSWDFKIIWTVEYKDKKEWQAIPFDYETVLDIKKDDNYIVESLYLPNLPGGSFSYTNHFDDSDSNYEINIYSPQINHSIDDNPTHDIVFKEAKYNKKKIKIRSKRRWMIMTPGNFSFNDQDYLNGWKQLDIRIMDSHTGLVPTESDDVSLLIRYKQPFVDTIWQPDVELFPGEGIVNGFVQYKFPVSEVTKWFESLLFEYEIKETDKHYRTIKSSNVIIHGGNFIPSGIQHNPSLGLIHFSSGNPVKILSKYIPRIGLNPYIDEGQKNGFDESTWTGQDTNHLGLYTALIDTNDNPITNWLQVCYDIMDFEKTTPLRRFLGFDHTLYSTSNSLISIDAYVAYSYGWRVTDGYWVEMRRYSNGIISEQTIVPTYALTVISPETGEYYTIPKYYDESTVALHTVLASLSGSINYLFIEFSGDRWFKPTTTVIPIVQMDEITTILTIDPGSFNFTKTELQSTIFTIKLMKYDRTPLAGKEITYVAAYLKDNGKDWVSYQENGTTDNDGKINITQVLSKFDKIDKDVKKDTEFVIKANYIGKLVDDKGETLPMDQMISPSFRVAAGTLIVDKRKDNLIPTRLNGYPFELTFSPTELCQRNVDFGFTLSIEYRDSKTGLWVSLKDKKYEFEEIYFNLTSGIDASTEKAKASGRAFKREFENGEYYWNLGGGHSYRTQLFRNNMDTGELIFRFDGDDKYAGCSANVMIYGCKNHFKVNHNCKGWVTDVVGTVIGIALGLVDIGFIAGLGYKALRQDNHFVDVADMEGEVVEGVDNMPASRNFNAEGGGDGIESPLANPGAIAGGNGMAAGSNLPSGIRAGGENAPVVSTPAGRSQQLAAINQNVEQPTGAEDITQDSRSCATGRRSSGLMRDTSTSTFPDPESRAGVPTPSPTEESKITEPLTGKIVEFGGLHIRLPLGVDTVSTEEMVALWEEEYTSMELAGYKFSKYLGNTQEMAERMVPPPNPQDPVRHEQSEAEDGRQLAAKGTIADPAAQERKKISGDRGIGLIITGRDRRDGVASPPQVIFAGYIPNGDEDKFAGMVEERMKLIEQQLFKRGLSNKIEYEFCTILDLPDHTAAFDMQEFARAEFGSQNFQVMNFSAMSNFAEFSRYAGRNMLAFLTQRETAWQEWNDMYLHRRLPSFIIPPRQPITPPKK